MRRPGGVILRLSDALGLRGLRETVLLPTVADMQHECGEARPGGPRTWARLRGYRAIASGCAFYAALLPWRHLRENWAGLDSPGPQLLRGAGPVAAFVLVLASGLGLAAQPNERGLGLAELLLLLPSLTLSSAAMALAMGVGWTLTRNPSLSRAAVSVGVLGAGLSFAFFELAVTRANREYRVAAYQAVVGPGKELRRGSREMTFRELGEAASLASVSSCPPAAVMSGCPGGPSPAFLRKEWHNRLSIPAFAFSFVILAAALSRRRRRAVVIPGLFLAYFAAHAVMNVGERLGVQGDVPAALASWIPHLVPLGLAAALNDRVTPADRGSVLADDCPLRP